MTGDAATFVLQPFLCFCRIGAFVMTLPGLSSSRIPVRVRLAIALALAAAVSPLVPIETTRAFALMVPSDQARVIVAETGAGAMLGMFARVFFSALQFAASIASATIGLSTPMHAVADDGEQNSAMTELIMLSAVQMFFASDLHIVAFVGVVDSYAAMPVGGFAFDEHATGRLMASAGVAFRVIVAVAGPFVAITMLVNLGLGLAARVAPGLPMQFLGVPLLLGVGLLMWAEVNRDMLLAFTRALAGGIGR